MTQSIKIPVDLQIRQIGGQLAELKKALKDIKPESAAWNKLNGVIEKLEGKFAALERHSKQAFSSTSEVKSFQREFERLAEGINSAADGFKNLKFDDLLFDNASLQDIKKAEQKIEDIKKSLRSLEAVSVENLFNAENTKQFKSLGLGDDIPESYDELIKTLKKKNKELSEEIQETQKTLSNLGSKEDNLKSIFQDPTTGADLQINKIKELFNKYNQTVNFEGGKLKTNIRTTLIDELQALDVELPKDFLKDLFTGDIEQNFEQSFNTIENRLRQSLNNITKTKGSLEDKLKDLNIQSATSANLLKSAKDSEQIFDSSGLEEYKDKLQVAQVALERLKQAQVQASGAFKAANSVIQSTSRIQSEYTQQIERTQGQLQSMEKVQSVLTGAERAVKQWFGFNEVINLTKRVVRDAVTEIKELDHIMTEISVVTEMTQADLWNQINTYGAIAEQYGVSTRGVYEVSQLWYQQGLQTHEVMNLTTETLKMAKIANLDYATATDYMTVALRGFKLEMSEANTVTDVYSALAAATASDTEELAIAMSKTASSAEAVGSSFESTSAMIATMISITREAPENIGSALKSIISRYGEMTSDPLKLVDSEGEEMNLNKVDKALQSVGISLQDANGQFRAFDDVILELAESWDTIDTNTQRYIATIMAGNRQQSRFLALVGNVEAYKDALETAANAEDAGTLQYLKTMDSIETKLQQVKTAWTQFYSSMGLEKLFKGALDVITNVIQKLNQMNKFEAFTTIGNIFLSLKSIVSTVFNLITRKVGDFINQLKQAKSIFEEKLNLQLEID